jgi:hypothetical protein
MAEAGRWKRYVQRQGQLLPAFVDDALDPSDPVFFVDDVVEGLELTALAQRDAVLGEHAYDPRRLLKRWLYGATQGVSSGRELARRVRRELAVRYLAAEGPTESLRAPMGTLSPGARLPRRLRRPRHDVRVSQRGFFLAVRSRPET